MPDDFTCQGESAAIQWVKSQPQEKPPYAMPCYRNFYLNILKIVRKKIIFLFFNVHTIDIPKKLCNKTPSNIPVLQR
jgi:hypothetical protein